ncbi:hypothetical protein [Cryobacterium tagatosivorans]|uniref:DUF559 domain-containing protein n=1 Tax=Cryobacterium tagatosivorans TaxID=1259199 RepID=A0A4R8UGR2_9MICO|nr:hypothetical protein [Cryobacterium tagatosivorans]TFB54999.1 hypothetical protein E3O23_02990 [Cryobacterium tagatosivorans]
MASRLPLPAEFRDGSFTTRTAADHGIGEGRLRGPDLARPFHSIRSPAAPVSVSERAEALQLRMPDAAFFCTVTAALIMGIPLPPRLALAPQLHVGMPAPMRACRAVGSIGHKLQLDIDDVGEWLGLRLTTAARTWCDLAAVLDVEDLVAAGDYIIHHRHPLAGRADLAAAAARHPARRGRARLLEALGLLDERAESPPESVIRVTIVRAGILGLEVNHPITDAFGRVIARADLCFPAHRVIFEYQGDYHRSEPDRWRKDRTRVARLPAAGWHVVEIAADELADRRMLLCLIRDTLTLHPPASLR